MTDASDEAYSLAWARFADLMKQHHPFEAFRMLMAADAEATVAMFQWMERQPPEKREQLAKLMLDTGGNA